MDPFRFSTQQFCAGDQRDASGQSGFNPSSTCILRAPTSWGLPPILDLGFYCWSQFHSGFGARHAHCTDVDEFASQSRGPLGDLVLPARLYSGCRSAWHPSPGPSLRSIPGCSKLCIRYTGLVSQREVSGGIVGGFTPLVATSLVLWSGGSSWPVSVYMIVTVVAGFLCAYLASDIVDMTQPDMRLRRSVAPGLEGHC